MPPARPASASPRPSPHPRGPATRVPRTPCAAATSTTTAAGRPRRTCRRRRHVWPQPWWRMMLPTSCLCSIDWIGCGVVLLRPTLCCSIPHPNPIQQPGCSTTTHRRSCCRPGHPPTGRRVHAPCAHRTAPHHLPVPQRSFSESPAKPSQHWRRRFFQAVASTTTVRFLRGCFQRLVWSNQRHTSGTRAVPLAHDSHAGLYE